VRIYRKVLGFRQAEPVVRVGRELAWLLALKFVALFLLWFLFFSPSHRSAVNSETTRERFALDAVPKAAARGLELSHEGATSGREGEKP
jgi:hypothetical protein